MEWTQFLILIATLGGLFLWNRSESRADHRALESWTKEMLTAMQQEIKDFHGKLERHDAEFKAHMMHNHDKK